jgi:hypothetical protein
MLSFALDDYSFSDFRINFNWQGDSGGDCGIAAGVALSGRDSKAAAGVSLPTISQSTK